VDEEAEPGIKRNPGKNEVKGVLNSCEKGQADEVDEPWREEGGVRGVKGFVGCEDREEDRCRDARAMSDNQLGQ
jgi:hypothetical protein